MTDGMWLSVSGAGKHINAEFSEIKSILANVDWGSISKQSAIKNSRH